MPGDGTKLDITTNKAPPPARLLDITRLVSRAGRRLTGVDRVEFAYLRYLAEQPEPLFAIARTSLGYVLLGASGIAGVTARIDGSCPWGTAGILSKLTGDKPMAVRQAESDLRRLALARCLPRRLPKMLAQHLPHGFAYLNTGHSNVTERMCRAVRTAGCRQIAFFIHDTIPLDFPNTQRHGTPERFRAMLARVQSEADLVIYNSAYSQERAEFHMRPLGSVPPGVVAFLGVDLTTPDGDAVPDGLDLSRPYFVALGTIEPRKGHGLLLDVWDRLARNSDAEPIPNLFICGARGWNNRDVFDRLDALPENGAVRELNDLSDGAIGALLEGANGLLFPSIAEGFGLPPVEAAALGVPVVCLEQPVYREVLGDIPVYAEETDCYQWCDIVKSLTREQIGEAKISVRSKYVAPTWNEHFNIVLSFI
jgi:glycosyltransferase involved in cell wall biosynthesis